MRSHKITFHHKYTQLSAPRPIPSHTSALNPTEPGMRSLFHCAHFQTRSLFHNVSESYHSLGISYVRLFNRLTITNSHILCK
ncbi:MAG: hypothetical protein AB8B99_08625 [Phormidesmis sp.]